MVKAKILVVQYSGCCCSRVVQYLWHIEYFIKLPGVIKKNIPMSLLFLVIIAFFHILVGVVRFRPTLFNYASYRFRERKKPFNSAIVRFREREKILQFRQ
uniref:Uncharacterized protein n=1 Tax=Cacopsylla melanoneura TaxID=428564 RepID=A0A8D8QLZ7_9HEMI